MTTRRLFSVLFTIAIISMTAIHATDPDMWWHFRTGEYIVQNGIPYQDVFSFTAPTYRWVTHEWLAGVLMWELQDMWGLPAQIIFYSLLLAATYGLVYKASEGRPYIAGFMIILAAMSSAVLWHTRPQVFNYFFLALFLLLLERYRRQAHSDKGGWWILVLMPLVALWANLHSGYLLGVVLLATYAIGDLLHRRLAPQDERVLPTRNAMILGGVAVGSFLAALANPNGWHIWLYPFETFGSSVIQGRILDWLSPDFHNPYNYPFVVFLGIGVLVFIFSPRRPTLTDLLLFGGTGVAGLISIRHIPFFALTATPIVCRHLVALVEQHPLWLSLTAERPAGRLGTLNLVIAGLALLLPFVRFADIISRNDAKVAQLYPVAAVEYMHANDLATRRLFNSYNWGGYLIWERIPVFVDGRADVYGDAFLTNFLLTNDARPEWRDALSEYDVEVVLIETTSPLVTVLTESQEWREVYRDTLATIFVRE